jgi:hypothetical protein
MRRINALLAYRGNDPDMLARQARLSELVARFRKDRMPTSAQVGKKDATKDKTK